MLYTHAYHSSVHILFTKRRSEQVKIDQTGIISSTKLRRHRILAISHNRILRLLILRSLRNRRLAVLLPSASSGLLPVEHPSPRSLVLDGWLRDDTELFGDVKNKIGVPHDLNKNMDGSAYCTKESLLCQRS
jgi:hypothetical protein